MTLREGKNRAFLLLAALLTGLILTALWASLAGAQSPGEEKDNDGDGASQVMKDESYRSGGRVPYEGPSGIRVSATGRANAAPDIAVVSLGVEALEDTASEARASAATAMTNVITVLQEAGIEEADIQTQFFHISPRYQHVEIERCDTEGEGSHEEGDEEGAEETELNTAEKTCYKAWENRLIGYSVSNQATVKVRNLDDTGSVIDKVADSAGDLVRINGVSFQIENTQMVEDAARTNAVAELFRKARMLAELSEVELGRMVYLSEEVRGGSPQPLYARAEAASADFGAATTPISGGQLELSISLQGVFLIGESVEPEEIHEPEATEENPEQGTSGSN